MNDNHENISRSDCPIVPPNNEVEHTIAPLNTEIEHVKRIILDGPLWSGDTYFIRFKGFEREIVLDSVEFQDDSKLLEAFEKDPDIKIRPCRTPELTASILRKAIDQRTQVSRYPSYGGWKYDEYDPFYNYKFWLFDHQFTHIGVPCGRIPAGIFAIKPMSTKSMLLPILGFKYAFQLDQTKPEGWLLSTVFHLSALTTLLQRFGCPFPMAFCFLTEDASGREWIKSWFSWFGDVHLSFELPSAVLARRLLTYKDQPVVILDEQGSEFSAENSALFESVLADRQIPQHDGLQLEHTPLQALPIILSSAASALTRHPNCITVEFPAKFSFPVPAASATQSVIDEYLEAFIGYTTEHIEQLIQLLNENYEWASCSATSGYLNETCVASLGILIAIDSFVREFYRDCGLNVAPLADVCFDIFDWITSMLEDKSEQTAEC